MIWLLRHGDAQDGTPDSERPLTDKGREQSRVAGVALKALGVEIDACWTSPKVRALDTARIACEQLDGVEPQEDEQLAGGDFDAAAFGDNVLLVGHEPDFSNAIRSLTGARVDLKKGGLAGVDGGELIVLMRPRELKRID
jgi:phosphohistidine phosphatase